MAAMAPTFCAFSKACARCSSERVSFFWNCSLRASGISVWRTGMIKYADSAPTTATVIIGTSQSLCVTVLICRGESPAG